MKKAIWIIVVALIFTLSGCAATTEPIISESDSSQTVNEEISSGIDEVDESESVVFSGGNDISAESDDPAENKKENHITQEHSIPQVIPETEATQETSIPPSTPAEPPKTEVTQPAAPSKTEESNPAEQPKAATAADYKAIADKIVEYINAYRSAPATKLPGLMLYAEYRSRQLVSNFAHDTTDERAAATALQYGEYVEPSLYGMTGDPYYTACARDAIAKAGYRGTVDYVAEQFVLLVKNSVEHWAYVGDAKYQYIAVGLTYDNGTWYCDIAVALENTDNK